MSAPHATGTVARVRRAAGAVTSPADALLVARMLGWALALPLLKSALPLERLVPLMARPGRSTVREPAVERRIGTLARLAHRAASAGRRDNCLERCLIAFRYLSAANAGPYLVVGARAAESGIEGHVWLLVDGTPVNDHWDKIASFTPVTVFDVDGRAHATPPAQAP